MNTCNDFLFLPTVQIFSSSVDVAHLGEPRKFGIFVFLPSSSLLFYHLALSLLRSIAPLVTIEVHMDTSNKVVG